MATRLARATGDGNFPVTNQSCGGFEEYDLMPDAIEHCEPRDANRSKDARSVCISFRARLHPLNSTPQDDLTKKVSSCLHAGHGTSIDQILDSYGAASVMQALFGLLEDEDPVLADAAVSNLQELLLTLTAAFGREEFLRLLSHSNEQVRIRATNCLHRIDATSALCAPLCFHNMITGSIELFTASAYAFRRNVAGMPWGTSPDGMRAALSIDDVNLAQFGDWDGNEKVLDAWTAFKELCRQIADKPGSSQTLLTGLDDRTTSDRLIRVAAVGWSDDGGLRALMKSSCCDCLRTKLLCIINLSQYSSQFDQETFHAIVSHLNSNDNLVRRETSRVVFECGRCAEGMMQEVIRLLDDGDHAVRWNLIQSVGAIGPSARIAVPKLISVLNEHQDASAIAAIEALGKIGSSSLPAVVGMLDLLKRGLPAMYLFGYVRTAFSGILWASDSDEMKKVVAAFGEALNDPNPDVRAIVAFGLSLAGQSATAVLPQIRSRLNDVSEEVRFWLHALLEEIGPPELGTETSGLNGQELK
jgi:HEAT repeat protein